MTDGFSQALGNASLSVRDWIHWFMTTHCIPTLRVKLCSFQNLNAELTDPSTLGMCMALLERDD